MSANQHRKKLLSLFEENQDGVIYLRGAEIMYRYGTDYEYPFRQESNFWYLTGVDEPDYHTIIDLKSGDFHLFMPKRDAQYAVWHGRIKPVNEVQETYNPDHLHYDHELLTVLKELNPETIYCLNEEQAEFMKDRLAAKAKVLEENGFVPRLKNGRYGRDCRDC